MISKYIGYCQLNTDGLPALDEFVPLDVYKVLEDIKKKKIKELRFIHKSSMWRYLKTYNTRKVIIDIELNLNVIRWIIVDPYIN